MKRTLSTKLLMRLHTSVDNMKKKEFTHLLEDFVTEILGYELSNYERRYFWKHFKTVSKTLKLDLAAAWGLEEMVHYDEIKIKRFRLVMANAGIELTIRQAEIWLVMLEIVLISVGFYEWEKIK